jgi:hypothetical protein
MVHGPAQVYRSSQLQYVSGLMRRRAGLGSELHAAARGGGDAEHVKGFMNHDGTGFMGGYGIAPILVILLVVFLVAAIVKMVQKKN